MKKILFATAFAASAILGLSACMNGDYDANPATTNSGVNPLNPTGSGGSGGGSSSFNWTGTDPMSAKIDGTGFKAVTALFQNLTVGSTSFDAVNGVDGTTQVLVAVPTNATAGTYASNGSTIGITYTVAESGTATAYSSSLGGSASIQVLENDATHIKGKFYGTLKSGVGKTKELTEGYFNVTK